MRKARVLYMRLDVASACNAFNKFVTNKFGNDPNMAVTNTAQSGH